MNQSNSGTSLIEVLVSLFLQSLILFGIDAIELSIIKLSQQNYQLSVNENQKHSLDERE